MKKKLLVLTLLVLTVGVLVVGCGSNASGATNSGIEGSTWTATSATDAQGNTVDKAAFDEAFGEITYQFMTDGKLVTKASDQTVEGKWKEAGDTVTVDAGGIELNATVEGDTMILKNQGVEMTFERNK